MYTNKDLGSHPFSLPSRLNQLPFSYSIKEPISAFAFLLGMLAVTGTTGDLTSILFGIPGEGSSAALILDGYPMSKNGEAGRALGAAITATSFQTGWL